MASRQSENISEMSNFEIIKEMEDLLKKYNRKTDKAIYKKSIVKLLQSAEVILAADVDFKKAQTDGEFLEKVILKTDVVKDSERKAIDKDVKDKLEVSKIKKKDYDTLCADGGSARATLDLYNEFYDLNSSNAFMKRDKLKDMLDDILGMDSRNTLHKFYNYFKETIFYLYIIFKEVDLWFIQL